MPPQARRALTALLIATAAAGCASLPAAQMVLPEALAGAPMVPLTGLKAGRSGTFDLAGATGRFDRGADRLSLFSALTSDRVSASYTLAPDQPGRVAASCKARQVEGRVGLIAGPLRPYGVRCSYEGAFAGDLVLDEQRAAAGARLERVGRLQAGGATLEIRSVHRVQGSPLPLEAPIGYVFLSGGQPVGAVELNGTTPRVWRTGAPEPVQTAMTHAALTLALIWDPAVHQP
jgi:hypothetical protein